MDLLDELLGQSEFWQDLRGLVAVQDHFIIDQVERGQVHRLREGRNDEYRLV